jgi:hypothetical protein
MVDYSPVSGVAGGNKRAGSLRTMQANHSKSTTSAAAAQHSIQQFDILNNKINNSSYVMPSTKQLLQNHSFRIASIQQQQQQQLQQMHIQQQPVNYVNGGLSGSNSYYVISQAPRGSSQQHNGQQGHEHQNGYRNVSLNRSASKKEHVERFDYI